MSDNPAGRYAAHWGRLERGTVGDLKGLAVPKLHFRDPFHELCCVDQVVAMLERMFDTLSEPRFVVTTRASRGSVTFYRWDFTSSLRGRAVRIEGVSEVQFDAAGLVMTHHDHWDAASQVYARMPLLGGVLGWLKGCIAAL